MLLSVTLVAFALVSTGLYLRPLWASEHTTLPAFLWLLSALPACGLWWFFHAADEHRSKRFPLDTAVGTFWGGVLTTCAYAVTLSVIVAAGQAETIGAAVSAVAGAASVGVLIICFRCVEIWTMARGAARLSMHKSGPIGAWSWILAMNVPKYRAAHLAGCGASVCASSLQVGGDETKPNISGFLLPILNPKYAIC